MRRSYRTRRTLTAVTLAAVGVLGTAGCGEESSDTAETVTSPTTTPTETSTPPEPTAASTQATTEPSEPGSTSASAPPATGTGLVGTLLPGAELPGLNAEVGWQETRTRRSESDPPRWVCQQYSLVADGAVRAVERTYAATQGGATAAQAVGRFADRRSAERAFAVLLANAENCAEQLNELGRKAIGGVDPLAPVPVEGGHAAWGVQFSGPVPGSRDDAYIDAVAVVQVRARVAVTSMSSIGQDYNYEPGQTPPEQTIPLVASALGRR